MFRGIHCLYLSVLSNSTFYHSEGTSKVDDKLDCQLHGQRYNCSLRACLCYCWLEETSSRGSTRSCQWTEQLDNNLYWRYRFSCSISHWNTLSLLSLLRKEVFFTRLRPSQPTHHLCLRVGPLTHDRPQGHRWKYYWSMNLIRSLEVLDATEGCEGQMQTEIRDVRYCI